MRRPALVRVTRGGMSVCFAGLVVAVGIHVPQINHTTLALALVLVILAVSMRWGWGEALAASLAGGLGFDYYVLPPRGFALGAPEHVITLLAFLCTAITTGWFAARANRHRNLAEERAAELARLHQLSNALLESGNPDAVLERISDQIVEIFGAQGAVFFDSQGDRFFRSGPGAAGIADAALREAASTAKPFSAAASPIAVVAVPESGSLGIAGASLSRQALDDVAQRITVAVARARAARESLDAELLRRSETLKSAVLDALAHELKGPLATIKVSVSTLLSACPGNPAQQRELIEIINEELERTASWIDNAIRMSSRDATDVRLNKASYQIGKVVARAMEGLGPQLDGRDIRIQLADPLPDASFDAEMIEMVIRQLADNAIKYSPPRSPIRIGAEFTGAELVITVADSGCGIPYEDQERIFEKHYRGRARGSGTPGTGLGLASAKCIMEAHGGEIWVKSAPGSGSVFHISLPVSMEAPIEHYENLDRR